MEAWMSLISAVIGGLIATIPTIINNIHQESERAKDREEARRERSIGAREKWTERDILKLMESTELLLRLFSESIGVGTTTNSLTEKREVGLLTETEFTEQLRLQLDRIERLRLEVSLTFDIMSRLVYSFEDKELESSYLNLLEAMIKAMDKQEAEEDDGHWYNVKSRAGKFQKVLREMLISIRDA